MKKLGSILLTLCLLCTLLTGCASDHAFAAEWSTDGTHHWHACTDSGCTEALDKAEHTWSSDAAAPICTVCGKAKNAAPSGADKAAYNTIADRVYSLAGDIYNGLFCVSLNQDGALLMVTTIDSESLMPEEDWGDVAVFEYDANGKMTAVTVMGKVLSVLEYDASGRPTKVGTGNDSRTMFTYEGASVTLAVGEYSFITVDQYGRCIKLEEVDGDESESYTLTFEGNVGTWQYSDAGEYDGLYTVVYENNNRMVKFTETDSRGSISYLELQYTAKGLPSEYLFVENAEEPEEAEYYRYVYTYNEAELPIAMECYEDGEKYAALTYEYDENGRLSKEIEYNGDGTERSIATYEYNAKGKLTKWETVYSSGARAVRETAYLEDGVVCEERYNAYDANGMLEYGYATLKEYHANGQLSKRTEESYDADGEKSADVTEYREDGTTLSSSMIRYDANGQKTYESIAEYYEDGDTVSKRITIQYADGVESSRYEESFDLNGDPIR